MEKLYLKARAKVNLTLGVLGKNETGYHNLDSVFQKINLYDELWLEKIKENKFILESDIKGVEVKDNILYKAYCKLMEELGEFGGVKVILKKNIPMQAGLAGGSTDCASFLLGMNELYHLKIQKEKMIDIAASLGADVVPCMYNKAVWAQGIGEKVQPIDTNFKYYFVIIKPNFACSTKEMYQKLDAKGNLESVKSQEVIRALETNKFEPLAKNLMNHFELVLEKNEEFTKIKEAFKEQGAAALLAGSGSCVYGIFENKQEAKAAYHNLKKLYNTYICSSYNARRSYFE